jgi:tRNA-2-methylthio-N6-dimethylallyladenosine synthase
MRRGYKSSDYLLRVEAIKTSRRKISLTTDIIVGFPGETTREFEDTIGLVQHSQFDGMYIFKYSARPGTPAAELPERVAEAEITDRFNALEKSQREIQSHLYAQYVGRTLRVLVEGESARAETDLSGHSTCQKVVNFPGAKSLIGHEVTVQIVAAKNNSLYGAPVECSAII